MKNTAIFLLGLIRKRRLRFESAGGGGMPVKAAEVRPLEGVSIVVCSLIAFHAADPFLAEFLRRGVTVWLYAPEKFHDRIRSLQPKLGSGLLVYEALQGHRRWALWLHRALSIGCTPQTFSKMYGHRTLGPLLRHRRTWVRWGVKALRALIAEVPAAEVNRRLTQALARWVGVSFPTKKVLAITPLTVPHLLCSRSHEVNTLMESWDHPQKRPVGYASRRVFVWSDALAEDWRMYQGDQDVVVGYPLKLKYAMERGAAEIGELKWRQRKVLYPATYSSYSDPAFFRDELAILDELCRVAGEAGLSVLVKPKPNGPKGDFESLGNRHGHVELAGDGGAAGPDQYFLDEAYNRERLDLMRRCDAVVNLGTTFGLDAAAFGLPVLQLWIEDDRVYPGVTRNFEFEHLQHLLGDGKHVLRVDAEHSLGAVLARAFRPGGGEMAAEFSRRLRRWLGPGPETGCEAVRRMVDVILDVPGTHP